LIHSCRRVQQLLVREIFLLGMSDVTLPIHDLTFRWANRFADAEEPIQWGRVKQTATAHLLQLPALEQNLVVENNDHELRSAGFPVALPNKSFREDESCSKMLAAKRCALLGRRHNVPPLFLPGIMG
jgi:hypothetical protein